MFCLSVKDNTLQCHWPGGQGNKSVRWKVFIDRALNDFLLCTMVYGSLHINFSNDKNCFQI